MNVLVTGGTGFIGTHLVAALLRGGHQVRVISRQPDAGLAGGLTGRVEVVQGNFFGETSFARCTEGIDLVYHLLWTSLPRSAPEFSVHYLEANVGYSLRLLDACVASGVGKVVFASSGGTVYGITDHHPIGEDAPLQPITNYGITKVAFEKYLALYHYQHGLDYAVARIANAYGEHQDPLKRQGVVAAWLYNILKQQEIEVWGDGSVVRDYIHADDLAGILVLLGSQTSSVKVFNVGSGVGYSLNQVLDTLREVTTTNPTVRYLRQHKDDVPFNTLDVRQLSKVLGQLSLTSFEQGVRSVYDHFRLKYS